MNDIEKMYAEIHNLREIIEQQRITDNKISENLKNEDSVILKVLDRMPFVAYINDKHRCLWVNACCPKMMGYSRDEWINQTPEEFYAKFHPDDIPYYFYKEFDEFNADTAPNSMYYECEYRMKNKAGEWRWIFGTCIPLEFDTNGDLILTMGTAIDITNRKNAEFEVKRLNDELVQLYENEKHVQEKRNKLLNMEIENHKRTLLTISEFVSKQNSKLIELKIKIESFVKMNPDEAFNTNAVNDLINEVDTIIESSLSWDYFLIRFEKLYPEYRQQIQKICSTLTLMENKVCVLLRCDLKTKDIANILNISERTVEQHRLRIRKKLNISSKDSLTLMLMKLGTEE